MSVDNDVEPAQVAGFQYEINNHVEAPQLQIDSAKEDDTLPSRQSSRCASLSSPAVTTGVRTTTATASCQVTVAIFCRQYFCAFCWLATRSLPYLHADFVGGVRPRSASGVWHIQMDLSNRSHHIHFRLGSR